MVLAATADVAGDSMPLERAERWKAKAKARKEWVKVNWSLLQQSQLEAAVQKREEEGWVNERSKAEENINIHMRK